jgi:hydroxyacylglutathione hydrolase
MQGGWPRDLGEGIWQFQTPLWQTNSLLAEAGGEILLCDPAYTHEEIDAIRSEAERRSPGAIRLVVTHADFDHTCGIPYFAAAEVIAGEETAAKIRSGAAEESLRTWGPPWGGDWPDTTLRVDRALPAGEAECGAFRLALIDAPSHGREGSAFVLLDEGILLPGDHISAMTYPFLGGPLVRAIEANERLLEAIDRHDLRWVVPGHGPALEPAEARRIGEEDLVYLRRLEAAAREARAEHLPEGYALVAVYEVEPPRETTPDFEVYELRTSNARRVVEELGRTG